MIEIQYVGFFFPRKNNTIEVGLNGFEISACWNVAIFMALRTTQSHQIIKSAGWKFLCKLSWCWRSYFWGYLLFSNNYKPLYLSFYEKWVGNTISETELCCSQFFNLFDEIFQPKKCDPLQSRAFCVNVVFFITSDCI